MIMLPVRSCDVRIHIQYSFCTQLIQEKNKYHYFKLGYDFSILYTYKKIENKQNN